MKKRQAMRLREVFGLRRRAIHKWNWLFFGNQNSGGGREIWGLGVGVLRGANLSR